MSHPDHVRETARRMRRENHTITEISRALGVPRGTVGDWVHGLEREMRCLLCGDLTPGRSSFCSHAHRLKHWKIFGGQIYRKRAA